MSKTATPKNNKTHHTITKRIAPYPATNRKTVTLKQYFQQDKATVGVVAVLLSELLPALLLWAVLTILGESPAGHIRWFAGAALPALLVVRAYAKHKECLSATKGAIVTLFATFLIFMLFLLKTHTI